MLAVWIFTVVSLFVTPVKSWDSGVICPYGWVESIETVTCIKVFRDSKTWYNARSACQAVGGDLVKIVNEPMNDFIQGNIASEKSWNFHYIGLNSIGQLGKFRWLDEFKKPSFTWWANVVQSDNYKCVIMYPFIGGQWMNCNCNHTFPFVCENVAAECHAGRYGERCSNLCSEACAGLANTCDRVGGACKNGCDPGYTGTKCDLECDSGFFGDGCENTCCEHCAGNENSCNHINGTCDLGCDPGYQSVTCIRECDSGFYGEGCEKTCSEHCDGAENSCHHFDGTCDLECETGYQNMRCAQMCDSGYYGERCERTCSEHCAGDDNSCHHVNGSCEMGCDPGYQNETCTQECDSGYYGDRCSLTCNEHCAGEDNYCHHVDGTCDLGCDPGYQGDWCTQEVPLDRKVEDKVQESSRWIMNVIISAVVVVGVVAVALLVIGLRTYRERSVSGEQKCKQTEQGGVMVMGLLSDD